MRKEYSIQKEQSEWQLLVDAPLSQDILDHSGNNNHFVQQSYTPTFNNNALYITGVNRGVTLGNSFFSSIWNNFKLEMDVKWNNTGNCGLFVIGGSWPNYGGTGIIKSSTDTYVGFYYAANNRYNLSLWPTNVWLHIEVIILNNNVKIIVTNIDSQEIIANINQTQVTSFGNGNLYLGGSFGYSQYWNGWIKNFKLYKHI